MQFNRSGSESAEEMLMHNGTEVTSNFSRLNSGSASSRDSLYIIIPITFIYTVIFVTGIIGNVSTCIVIFSNKFMHTATNFYLFSLAVSDLVLLFSALPKEVYELWFRYSYFFGEVTCIVQGFASEAAVNATVLTITAFTIERYVAICHPFMSQAVSKLSRAIKHIMIIWLLALVLAVPQAIQFGLTRSSGGVECTVQSSIMDHAFEISSLVFFIMPMFIISALYILIAFRLRDSRIVRQVSSSKSGNAERQLTKNQSRVIRMLVVVVVAFIICWAPFHAQRLFAIYGLRDMEMTTNLVLTFYSILTYISGILYYLSATINPILYNIMSHRFRRAFTLTFGHQCGCCMSKNERRNHIHRACSNSSYQNQQLNHHYHQQLKADGIPLNHVNKMTNIGELSEQNSFEENQKVDAIMLAINYGNTLLTAPIKNIKCSSVKKERSPITTIKNKLNAIRHSNMKKNRNKFYSMTDVSETKTTEIESLHHSEC